LDSLLPLECIPMVLATLLYFILFVHILVGNLN
jgi:hypothetical protein